MTVQASQHLPVFHHVDVKTQTFEDVSSKSLNINVCISIFFSLPISALLKTIRKQQQKRQKEVCRKGQFEAFSHVNGGYYKNREYSQAFHTVEFTF